MGQGEAGIKRDGLLEAFRGAQQGQPALPDECVAPR